MACFVGTRCGGGEDGSRACHRRKAKQLRPGLSSQTSQGACRAPTLTQRTTAKVASLVSESDAMRMRETDEIAGWKRGGVGFGGDGEIRGFRVPSSEDVTTPTLQNHESSRSSPPHIL